MLNTMKQKPKAILIDSSNLLHRAVWIAENVRTNVNPSYIFLTSVRKYANMFECNNIYSVWDKRLIRGVKNYRRQAKQADYKGTRDEEKNARVFKHEELTTSLLDKLGVKNMYPGILEADDVISWLSKKISGGVVIVSVDQDMLQLVTEKNYVYSPIKDVTINYHNFEETVGVDLNNFIRYKSLIGDKSDNLPGVHKCGPKTAKKYIEKYADDEQMVSELGEEKLAPYFFNLEMIDLSIGHEKHPEDITVYEHQYEKLSSHEPDFDAFFNLCESLNMNAITSKKHDWSQAFDNKQLGKTLEDIVNSLGINK